jgi:hypothetical protein
MKRLLLLLLLLLRVNEYCRRRLDHVLLYRIDK